MHGWYLAMVVSRFASLERPHGETQVRCVYNAELHSLILRSRHLYGHVLPCAGLRVSDFERPTIRLARSENEWRRGSVESGGFGCGESTQGLGLTRDPPAVSVHE